MFYQKKKRRYMAFILQLSIQSVSTYYGSPANAPVSSPYNNHINHHKTVCHLFGYLMKKINLVRI